MCGRYSLISPYGAIQDQLGLESLPGLVPRYNIAPTQRAPVVRLVNGRPDLASMRWGLLPFRARGTLLINARMETAASKPAFRQAWRHRRCVVPADGFYEWQKPSRQAFHIHLPHRRPFVFAGLWDEADATKPATFTILTTEASANLRPIHHRMPVILGGEAIGRWLRAGPLQGLSGDVLEADAVSSRVNSAANDGPECLAPPSREGPRDLFD